MSDTNQAAFCVSDDGKVTPCGPDEQPDVIYDENGKIKTVSVRLLLMAALAKAPEIKHEQ